ncbi:hypothetical protein VTO73DRAFT_4918 [Trametes versicolor]
MLISENGPRGTTCLACSRSIGFGLPRNLPPPEAPPEELSSAAVPELSLHCTWRSPLGSPQSRDRQKLVCHASRVLTASARTLFDSGLLVIVGYGAPTINAARTADSSGIPPELFGSLQEFFACTIIGFPIATTIYGITVLQTYLYFRRYPKDSVALKSLVGGLWALDTLTIVLISHAIYNLFVLNLGHIADDVDLPWLVLNLRSVALEIVVTNIITVAVQYYFADQLHKRGYPASFHPKSSSWVFPDSYPNPPNNSNNRCRHLFRDIADGVRLFPETSPLVSLLGGVQAGLALLCDMLITGGLCFHFRSARVVGGRARTNALVDKLMVYAIHRCALTTVIQGACLVTLVTLPRRHVYIIFSMMIGKLYVNSLLASLNVRASLNRAALADTTVSAATTTTTLRFRGDPYTVPSTDGEYSVTAGGAGIVIGSEQGWDNAERSRLAAPRMLVSRSSASSLGSGEEIKMREHVENAA